MLVLPRRGRGGGGGGGPSGMRFGRRVGREGQTWALGLQMTTLDPRVPLITPHQLFQAAPAHALHEAALYLADVDGRVQAGSNIHHNVHAASIKVAIQGVKLHFRTARAVGEVVERPSAAKSCTIDLTL